MLFRVEELSNYPTHALIDDKWVAARPYNHKLAFTGLFTRLKHCWLVLTGKADIVVWYKQ